jgi:GMP synthase-like glutamine amidotransferase
MRLCVLQHVPFEGPAAIADWAAARGAALSTVRLYEGEPMPDLAGFDSLAIMGGPMSVNDGARHEWLNPEIAFVREAIQRGKTVLGICLGAQMIAKALGARVYEAPVKEIGWFPVHIESARSALFAGLPEEFMAFHWHGETFDLPDGAAWLASTPAVSNQAFALGEKVLGLQFHMESTAESVSALLENAAEEIGSGPYEQRPKTIRDGIKNCGALKSLLYRVLDNLTAPMAEGT